MPSPESSHAVLTPNGRRMLEAIESLPADEQEAFCLIRIQGLTLDEAIRERPAESTAREILATLRTAQDALATQAGAATAETVGRDSETGRAVLAAYAGRVADDG